MWSPVKLLLIGALSFEQVKANNPFAAIERKQKVDGLFKEEFLSHPFFSEKLHSRIVYESKKWPTGNQMPAIGGTHFPYYLSQMFINDMYQKNFL